MKPTPAEIALIAATLARNDGSTPSSKLMEAERLITEAAKMQATFDEAVKKLVDCATLAPDKRPIPLEVRLEQLMPRLKDRDHRKKKFWQFLEQCIREEAAKHSGVTEQLIRSLTRTLWDRLKTAGVKPQGYSTFAEWYRDGLRRERQKSGKKGGQATKAKRDAAKKVKASAIDAKKRKKSKIWQSEITHLPITPANEEALDRLGNPRTKTPIRGADSVSHADDTQ
jgi:hypothetical protein